MKVDRKLLAVGIIAISLAGCGGAGKGMPKLGTVTGTVTLDGQPLKGAKVQFVPNDSRPSGAITDDQGNYELIFNENAKGAAVGKHTVRISLGSAMEPEKLPQKYNLKTELSADVKEGKNEKVDFALKSK